MFGSLQLRPKAVRRKENTPNAARKIGETGSIVESGTSTLTKRTMKVPSRERMRRTEISLVV
jgi:hypothetical protein